jgi:hypothetical protein
MKIKLPRLLLLIEATLLFLGLLAGPVLQLHVSADTGSCPAGMSQLDCSAILGNWANWIPGDGTNGCTGSGGPLLSGTDNIQKAMNYFVGKGLSPQQAAGLVGNLKIESGLNPTAQQDGSNDANPKTNVGFGIAQWTTDGRQQGLVSLAQKEGAAVNTLGVQLDYVWQELNGGYAAALAALKQTDTARSAAVSIMVNYEAPADSDPSGPNAQARGDAAEAILALYGSGSLPDSGNATPSTTSTTSDTCGSTEIGTGSGKFTTDSSVTYPGVDQMLARAKELSNNNSALFHQVCDGPDRCYHRCDHLVAGAWGHSGSGYDTAMTHWAAMQSSGHAHPGDRNPPVGALLFYDSGEAAGHVALYLGNNRVLSNDVNGNGGAYIVDASAIETGPWRLGYLGWSDPVFAG